MRFTRSAIAFVLAAAALPGVTSAEDKPTTLVADFGYVQTTGNSEVTTVSGTDKLQHHAGPWSFTQEAGAVWGETEGVESAGRYGFSLRADRSLNERLSAYGLASWQRNTFSGISRQFNEGLGLVWHVVMGKPHTLDLEGGAGLTQRRTTLHQDESFSTGRAGALYAYDFSEKSRFEARGAYLVNLEDSEDSEGNARMSVTAPIAGSLALKVSYDLLYRNKPQPGLEKLDTTLGVGVQATF